MLRRSHSIKYKEQCPSYMDVDCCPDWYSLSTFKKWVDQNYEDIYDTNGDRLELDKDILQSGTKVYSPETCLLIPRKINRMVTYKDNRRGFNGVSETSYSKTSGVGHWVSRVSDPFNGTEVSKSFKDEESAYRHWVVEKVALLRKALLHFNMSSSLSCVILKFFITREMHRYPQKVSVIVFLKTVLDNTLGNFIIKQEE